MLDGRDQPIITCLEYIREYLMKRIVTVQGLIDRSEGLLTPTATGIFKNIKNAANDIIVTWNGDKTYQCNGPWDDQCVVDMRLQKCACRRWELTGIPCKHAVTVMWNMVQNRQREDCVPEEQVHKAYWMHTWKEIYANKIVPTNGIEYWPRSGCPTKCAPPFHHTQIGRPKKKRQEAHLKNHKGGKVTKLGKSVCCSKCRIKGHNTKSCQGRRVEDGASGSQVRKRGQVGATGANGSQVSGSKKKSVANKRNKASSYYVVVLM